jgi:hypothetical protein
LKFFVTLSSIFPWKGVHTGTINSANNSAVNLGGMFTLAGLGTFNGMAGTVMNITGTLNNPTLTLNATTGSWTLAGGTINGGTLNFLDGQTLGITGSGGTLSGVTVNGDLTLGGVGAFVRISNGLTLNGTAHLSGSGAQIHAIGDQTFGGSGTIAFESSADYLTIEGSAMLTLASGFTVRGGIGNIASSSRPLEPTSWSTKGRSPPTCPASR